MNPIKGQPYHEDIFFVKIYPFLKNKAITVLTLCLLISLIKIGLASLLFFILMYFKIMHSVQYVFYIVLSLYALIELSYSINQYIRFRSRISFLNIIERTGREFHESDNYFYHE